MSKPWALSSSPVGDRYTRISASVRVTAEGASRTARCVRGAAASTKAMETEERIVRIYHIRTKLSEAKCHRGKDIADPLDQLICIGRRERFAIEARLP